MDFIREKSHIYAEDASGRIIAEIDYPEISPGVFNITHTYVDNSLRGQGIAAKLVEAAVDDIKSQNAEVRASCWYAVKWLSENAGKTLDFEGCACEIKR